MSTPTQMAVLFADVSGSTRLYETIGDAQALAKINECLGLLRGIVSQFGGRVVKTIGDELMCVFPDAESCALAACEMQAGVEQRAPVAGVKLAIRVGFHYGPLIEQAGDVFGDTVNLAARMVGIAKGGQVMTTRQTVEALGPNLRASSRCLEALAVKGKQSEVDVHELLWQQSDDVTVMAGRAMPPRSQNRLRLVHAGREIVLDETRESVSFGRELTNDISITDRMASRHHARIERRRDKFVLADQSTNGTFVLVRGDREMTLRREEFTLRGSGVIAFGHSVQSDDAERVEFHCD